MQRVVTELGESIPDDELREMVEEADRDQDGFVVFEDFYRIMKKPSDDDDEASSLFASRSRVRHDLPGLTRTHTHKHTHAHTHAHTHSPPQDDD